MIQRIQTVYLALGAALIAFFFTFDVAWRGAVAEAYGWFTPVTVLIGALTALGAVAAIFLYRDRQRQRQVIVWVQLLTVLFLVLLFGSSLMLGVEPLLETEDAGKDLLLPLGLPVLAYVFFFLARRGVEKDIKLIRSMDRLR